MNFKISNSVLALNNIPTMKAHYLLLLLVLTAKGAIAQDLRDTPINDSLPARWTFEAQFEQTTPVDDNWWSSFNDSTLLKLLDAGETNNYNLAIASRRIRMARLAWKNTASPLFPHLSLRAGFTAEQNSARTGAAFRETDEMHFFSIGADVSWEIDIFGRVAAARKGGKAAIASSKADYAATQVSMAANIAKNYVALRMYQMQLKTAQSHIKSQEKIVAMTKARKDVGLASGLDVAQAEQVLMSTLASVPTLKNGVRTSINAIALLTGYTSSQIESLVGTSMLPSAVAAAPLGVPAELMRRRPDVVQAEYILAQDAANVGIAKKDFLPTLSLQGSVATEARKFTNLFGSHSITWQISPTLTWEAFSGFSRRYAVATAKEQMLADIDNYNLILMTAIEETENALSGYVAAIEQKELVTAAANQADKTLELSVDLYKQGLDNFTTVANAQITSLQARMDVITAASNVLNQLIALYQALGGGWSAEEIQNIQE